MVAGIALPNISLLQLVFFLFSTSHFSPSQRLTFYACFVAGSCGTSLPPVRRLAPHISAQPPQLILEPGGNPDKHVLRDQLRGSRAAVRPGPASLLWSPRTLSHTNSRGPRPRADRQPQAGCRAKTDGHAPTAASASDRIVHIPWLCNGRQAHAFPTSIDAVGLACWICLRPCAA
jgi:hypothetical protein